MDEYRKLVYEDKTSLADFFVNDKNPLNCIIYEEWLSKRVEIDPFDANHHLFYLKTFNDAYYICTLALLIPVGKEIRPNRLLTKIDRPSLVFPMVYFYLSNINGVSKGIKLFLHKLDTAFKIRSDWQQNYDDLKVLMSIYDNCIEPEIFSQRQLTSEVLSHLNWCELTQTFNIKKIEDIVINYARSKVSWDLMIKAIETSARKYDYDFGFEDYTEEGVDEDGPYIRTIKVPKDPYDINGEEYLEPLKRAGVFQFCNELLAKYDELTLKSESLYVESGISSEPVIDNREKSCFNHTSQYVKQKVREICKQYYLGSHANLALIEMKLFENEWLKKYNRHKDFVKELIAWGIIPLHNEEDLKKVTLGITDKMRKIRNSGYNMNDTKIMEGIDKIMQTGNADTQ